MIERRAAHRYALALIGTAETPSALEQLLQDMRNLNDTVVASHELKVFLQSPVVNKEKKKTVLQTLLAPKLSKPMQDFLMLLCEKRRENIIPFIIEEFNALSDARMGIIRPRIASAVELSEKEKKALESQLAARYNKRIMPAYSVNKALRGGVVVQVGDTIINGSIAHQLESLGKRMHAGMD